MTGYAYEVCDDCVTPVGETFGLDENHEPRTYWFADNELWNAVIGSEAGVLCPACFTTRCGAKGIAIGWRAGRVGDVELDRPIPAGDQAVASPSRVPSPDDPGPSPASGPDSPESSHDDCERCGYPPGNCEGYDPGCPTPEITVPQKVESRARLDRAKVNLRRSPTETKGPSDG